MKSVKLFADFVESHMVFVPEYEVARRYAELARESTNPYKVLSYLLTAHYAYEAAVYEAAEQRRFGRYTPRKVYLFTVEDNAFPQRLTDIIVEEMARTALLFVESRYRVYEQGEIPLAPTFLLGLDTLVAIANNKNDVEKAMKLYDELRSKLPVKSEHYLLRATELRDKAGRHVIVEAELRAEPDHVLKTVEELGMKVEEHTLDRLKVYIATKRFGNVEVLVNTGTDKYGFINVIIHDHVDYVDGPGIYGPITAEPMSIDHPAKTKYTVKIQRTGHKLVVTLTKALSMIGLDAGDTVEVTVDTEKRIITIRPAQTP